MLGAASSTVIASPLNGNAAYWSARRAAVKASVYPSGPPVAGSDSSGAVTLPASPAGKGPVPTPIPTGVTRYVLTNPGGRTGGTPLYVDSWPPEVTGPATGKCLVHLSGHDQGEVWYGQTYLYTDGSSIMRRWHANGGHVLSVGIPGYDVQPQPCIVVCNGVPVSNNDSLHGWSTGFSDGGPSPNRIFCDHVIQAMNSITADTGITAFSLVCHSGGAASGAILAACEDRFKVVHILQGGTFSYAGTITDIELWTGNPVFAAACGGSTVQTVTLGNAHPALVAAGAAVVGRKTVVHFAPTDEYFGDQAYAGGSAAWADWVAKHGVWLRSSCGAGVDLYIKNTARTTPPASVGSPSPHTPDSTQAAWVEAHLLANM